MSTYPAGPATWQRIVAAQNRRQLRFAERTEHQLPGWRTTARRRLAIGITVAGLGLMLLGVVVALVGVIRAPLLFLVVWIGGTVLALGGWYVLRVLTSNVTELPTTMLDEHEADQRDAARSVGFQVMTWATLAPLLLLLVGTSADDPSTLGFPAALLLTVSLLLGGLTPTLLLAWSAHDPEPDDGYQTDDVADDRTPTGAAEDETEGTRG